MEMDQQPAIHPFRAAMDAVRLRSCRSPWWARGGHLQTLLGHLLPSRVTLPQAESHKIPLQDGDALRADFYSGSLPILLYLFHGLGGSTESDYMRRMITFAHGRGYSVLAVNHRGCGSGRGLAVRPYHSGRADDLASVIAYGRITWSDCRHLAIGFSLSGNALLLLSAGQRGHEPPDAAIAVNAPINLEKAAYLIKSGLNRLYDLRFVYRCRQAINQRVTDNLIEPIYQVPRWSTLHDFDNYYTAPAAGFRDREDYYQQCSAGPHLAFIRIPTVVLTSADDPFVDVTDYRDAGFSECAHLHIEPTGGHMGYLDKNPANGRWLEQALGRYLIAINEYLDGASS